MDEYQFMGWYHLLTVSKNNKIPMPKKLPDCLSAVVLQKIVQKSFLDRNSLIYAILNNNKNDDIKKIILENENKINEKDLDGMKPIEIAITLGDESAVNCLIENNNHINDKYILIQALKQRKHEIAMSIMLWFLSKADGNTFDECMCICFVHILHCSQIDT